MITRRKNRTQHETPRLQMTPMIDVVFQLLIFFIVTLSPIDIFSHLDVSRPRPDDIVKVEPDPDLVRIIVSHVHPRFSVNGRAMTLPQVESWLLDLTSLNRTTPITIHCTDQSSHQSLIRILDLCWKLGLENLSVFSLGRGNKLSSSVVTI